MRLLILTQVIDKKDPMLGFFHVWLTEFSKRFEIITAICLKEGEHDLPDNVRVFSLGKEEGVSHVTYVWRFFKYAWQFRNEYDAVFSHMNQEYVILGGLLWQLMGKKVTMWRNHYAGTWFTDLAVMFCDKVFCTSKFSYTAKFKKTVFMPVGVSESMFAPREDVKREPHAILSFGRVSPSKKIEKLIEALGVVAKRGVDFSLTICGDISPEYKEYAESLVHQAEGLGISDRVCFEKGIPYEDAPHLYARHGISVNQSPSGMYDKTIFEAMLSGTLALSCNENLRGEIDEMFLFREDDVSDLAHRLEVLLALTEDERRKLAQGLRTYALEHHSLGHLAEKLKEELMINL